MATVILGISAFYHDSAAAILVDGQCVAAAQEERFTRRKHDPAFPVNAIRYVLHAAGVGYDDLAAVAFYEKSLLKFERILETAHAVAPFGLPAFLKAMPVWIKEKLFMRHLLRRHVSVFGKHMQSLKATQWCSSRETCHVPSPPATRRRTMPPPQIYSTKKACLLHPSGPNTGLPSRAK